MANIQENLNDIKNALFGKDVRGSMHDGIDAINKEVESTTARQVDLDNTFDQLVINAGNSNAEIVDARVGEDGASYNKLGDRLDNFDTQMEAKTNKIVDIESLKSKNLKVGEVVFIENYDKNIKNNSHHFRIISSVDNGTGIILNNGMCANLLYTDEINITHLGAYNSNEHGNVCDIKPFIDKIVKITPLPKIKIPHGFWGISTNNYVLDGFQIEGVSEQLVWKFPATTNVNSTILFPIDSSQDATLSIGNKLRECRGMLIKGINIVTNSYNYVNNVLTVSTNGATIGLDLNTVTFSKIRDIIVSGNNNNVVYGIKFNGFETYFTDIMFRMFGKLGSIAEYAFYTYGRHNDGMYSEPSGLIYSNMNFEGVGCSWMNLQGVDVQVLNINGENGWWSNSEGVTYIPQSSLTTYTPLAIFTVSEKLYSCNISNVTIQGMGKMCYEKGGQQFCLDTIVRTDDAYGDFSNFTMSNVNLQDSKKDIYGINYKAPNSLTDSNGDNPNKTIKTLSNIVSDNYSVLYRMKDNHVPRFTPSKCVKTNGLMYNDNVVNVVENTVYPKDSSLQHNVCFDNVNQQEYIKTLRKKYTAIENVLGIFKANDSLEIGTYQVKLKYKMRWGVPSVDFKIIYKDSTEQVESMTLSPRDNDSMRTKVFTFTTTSVKDIDKIVLINVSKSYDLRLYSMNITLV